MSDHQEATLMRGASPISRSQHTETNRRLCQSAPAMAGFPLALQSCRR